MEPLSCRGCGHQISAEDAKCPRCRKQQAPVDWPTEIVLQILGIVLTIALFGLFGIR
jgi:hypothetical protein